ncbi:MAG: hypothetical protein IBV53_05325 [Candidatus Atribacteria bacterium]
MFNNLVLEQINRKISVFQRANFKLYEYSFKLSNYDIINTNILFNSIVDEKQSNILIFHPHRNIFLLYAIGILSFSALFRDLTSMSTSFEKNLSIGCRVKLDESLGIYKGKCFKDGKEYLEIYFGGKFKDTSYISLLENLARLSIYKGSDTKLRGWKKKKSNQKPIDTISNILNIEKSQLNVVRQSRIALITEKKDVLDLIKDLKINDCKFSDIFPIAKLTSADKDGAIPGIHLEGRQPVIYFVSSFGALFDFIQRGNEINTLILDSASKVESNFSNINSLKDNKNIKNILIFLNHIALNEKRDFEGIGFKSWIWTRKDFSELESLGLFEKPENNFENPFNSHYRVLKSLAKQKIDLIDIEQLEEDTEKIFNEAIEIVNKLMSYNRDADNTKLNELLITVLGCLFYFQHLIYPDGYALNLSEDNDFYIGNSQDTIDKIKFKTEELLSMHMSSNLKYDFNELLNILKKIKKRFLLQNHKADELLNFLRENYHSSIAIIVRKPWQREILLGWLQCTDVRIDRKSKKRNSINVIDFKSFQKWKNDIFYDIIIFSGWYGYKNKYIFNTGISSHIIFLLYPFEKRQVENFLSVFEKDGFNLRDINIRAELLGISSTDFTLEKAVSQKTDYFKFEGDLTRTLDKLNLKTVSDIGNSYRSDEKDAVLANLVIFEEGEFAFLTKNYRAKKLNRIEEKIEFKNPEDLEREDEIIFLSDSRKDIFDELIQITESGSLFSTEVRVSKIWKNAIRKYLKFTGKDIQIFTEELDKKGCKKHPVTVKNWVESKYIIGPENEKETLKSIIEVTEDLELKNNLKEVIFACRKLRALHIRLGKYLAQCIFASIDSQQGRKIDGVMRNRIRELSECIITAQVKAVDKNYKKVARNKVNCLLEIGD